MTTTWRTVYLVFEEERRWRVEQQGGACLTSLHDDKAAAVAFAMERARRRAPSQVEILGPDGCPEDVCSFDLEPRRHAPSPAPPP